MDQDLITRYIRETFEGVEVVAASGGVFFFYGAERMFPFATLVNTDEYDSASNLNRAGVFRLNVGVGKETYRLLFGEAAGGAAEVAEKGHDFAALDRIMPHPVYGRMYWVCVLNPSEETFEGVKPLLREAYEMAVRKRDK